MQIAVGQQWRSDTALRRPFAVGFSTSDIPSDPILILTDDRRLEP